MVNHRAILIGIATGAGAGLMANTLGRGQPWLEAAVEYGSRPLGQLFLRALFMLVIPLVFSALVVGISDLEVRALGRIGLKTLGYTVVMSVTSVALGLALVNWLRPGDGMSSALSTLTPGGSITPAAPPQSTQGVSLLVSMIPDNPIKAAASGDMIGLIVFALVFGVALSTTRTDGARALKLGLQGLYDVMMRLIDGVLRLAPVGVGALLFTMTATLGLEPLRQLAAYVLVVLLALGLHMFGVYSLSVWFLGGMNPLRFFSRVKLAMTTAFSTASSTATLPTALKVAEEELGLPKRVTRFVLVAGSTLNQNGTALFEGVTVLFIAQLYGVELGLAEQATVMFICVLAGIGTAGVPAASLPVIAMILGLFKIPPEGLGLVLGVDRFLDMCRTTLNVTGDLAAAVYVAKGEPTEEASTGSI